MSAIWESVTALALRDELTGLYNRRGVYCLGESLLATARKNDQRVLVGYIDLDGLMRVNDHGRHAAADDDELHSVIRDRLQGHCDAANDSRREWPLSLTVGSSWYNPRWLRPIGDLIDSADRHLCDQRRGRRSGRAGP